MSPGVGLTWMKSGRLLSGLVAIDVRVGVRVFGCVRARVCGMCARCMGVGVPAGLQAPPVPICSVRISGGVYAVRVGRTPSVLAALGEGVAWPVPRCQDYLRCERAGCGFNQACGPRRWRGTLPVGLVSPAGAPLSRQHPFVPTGWYEDILCLDRGRLIAPPPRHPLTPSSLYRVKRGC